MEAVQIIIVDDEPIAHDILSAYIDKIPNVELVGKCKNALEAFAFLSKNKVDIMLLDINMPEISGLDFLKTIKEPPLVIFTTAYSQYAVESYELNATDYLLKPFSFERFQKAILKALEVLQTQKSIPQTQTPQPQNAGNTDVIFVRSEGKLIRLNLQELWLVEGLKDYVRLYTLQDKPIIHSTMKNLEEQLSEKPEFVRVNKSFIINTKFISSIDGNCIVIKEQKIPVGSTYKDVVQRLISQHKLI